MMRNPPCFVSDEDFQTYRKWMRNLTLAYMIGTIVFAAGATALRVEKRLNDTDASALTSIPSAADLEIAHR